MCWRWCIGFLGSRGVGLLSTKSAPIRLFIVVSPLSMRQSQDPTAPLPIPPIVVLAPRLPDILGEVPLSLGHLEDTDPSLELPPEDNSQGLQGDKSLVLLHGDKDLSLVRLQDLDDLVLHHEDSAP